MTKKEYRVTDRVTIENAKIMFRNFSGEATQYNPKGSRNFCIFLDDDQAKDLASLGWNIRYLTPRDNDPPQAMLSVKVAFGNFPPNAILIKDGRQTKLNEETIGILDWAELETCDVVLSPYTWTVQGQTGVKAYLKSLYAVLRVDPLAAKYNYHEGADEAIGGCGDCEVCDGTCGKIAALK